MCQVLASNYNFYWIIYFLYVYCLYVLLCCSFVCINIVCVEQLLQTEFLFYDMRLILFTFAGK